jgi:hypothetical protein
MSHITLRKFVFDAARTVKDRRARDEEVDPRPDDDDLDARMKAEDVVALVERFLENCSVDEAEDLLTQLMQMKATHENEQGIDRAHRGIHGAARARGAGDFLDRAHRPARPAHAGDAALPRGVKPARERFAGLARVQVMG